MALSEIQNKSIEMLLQGTQQKDVAATLEVTPKTLQRWAKIPEYAARLNNDPIPQATQQATNTQYATEHKPLSRSAARDKELALLDTIQTNLENLLDKNSGDLRIIDRLLKVSERRSRLLGLEVKNMAVLEAAEILMSEGVITPRHAYIISQGIESIEGSLKDADSA
ncbi:hypothetical protein [Anabaena lutea]|uniref:Uncharacterized protein n=1 Tax=Anabaena lutea FACHB-196 TaxID=2692881 RepID=A0ABR8FNW5_9NOST|nr:hypothetical protein [Anabaena lutea]MBD2571367.1 hypothetical protein [Anabaena lutea FACHB-196]